MNKDFLKKQIKAGAIQVVEPETSDHYKISTGSSKFDLITDGGLGAGLIRIMGATEGGKTSLALEIANNFLDEFGEKGKVAIIKAEMRLSLAIQERSRRPFVIMKPEHELEALEAWDHTNMLVYSQNIYPKISDFILGVMASLDPDEKFLFILDSLDWVKMEGDYEAFIDPKKKKQPGSIAKYTKEFLRHVTPLMTQGGHMGIFISQVSTNIKIDKYSGHEQKEIVAVGGNALLHAADWTFQVKPKTASVEIKAKPDSPADPDTNPILGHNCRIKILKSPNETTNYSFEYPVKHGASVWKELELVHTLRDLGFLEKRGSWFALPPKTVRMAQEKFNLELPEKVQGEQKLIDLFEDNPDFVNYLDTGLKKALKANKISKASIMAEMLGEEEDEEDDVL